MSNSRRYLFPMPAMRQDELLGSHARLEVLSPAPTSKRRAESLVPMLTEESVPPAKERRVFKFSLQKGSRW